jgi:hypothetical protein
MHHENWYKRILSSEIVRSELLASRLGNFTSEADLRVSIAYEATWVPEPVS